MNQAIHATHLSCFCCLDGMTTIVCRSSMPLLPPPDVRPSAEGASGLLLCLLLLPLSPSLKGSLPLPHAQPARLSGPATFMD